MKRRRNTKERLDKENAVIAIAGSGLAGLSTAIALEQAGFMNIHIYERDPSFSARKDGYGLTLTYNPNGTLSQLGVLEEVADADCPSRSHYFFGASGDILGYFGNAFCRDRGWGQRRNLRVPRQIVRKTLIKKLVRTKIYWDHQISDLKPEKEGSAVRLFFSSGNSQVVDLLVAADGIRSSIVDQWLPRAPRPKSLGVRLTLGLTRGFQHPLVKERGFYTLADGKRLFVMPFSGTAFDQNEPVRIMWQLSFPSTDDTIYSADELLKQCLQLTAGWHQPVQSLLVNTPLDSIWGTLLCDRDPCELNNHLKMQSCQRVLLAGDALHAMSPFKGQGANQCLQDGLTIAKWLGKASIEAAIKGAMREMVQRTNPVVRASREAAVFWHSSDALREKHKFAGVPEELVQELLDTFLTRSIDAETSDLDRVITSIIDDMNIPQSPQQAPLSSPEELKLKNVALTAAAEGNLCKLREISWIRPMFLQSVFEEDTKRTCLHLAAAAGHIRTVFWLVTEGGCKVSAKDSSCLTPSDVASSEETKLLIDHLSKLNT